MPKPSAAKKPTKSAPSKTKKSSAEADQSLTKPSYDLGICKDCGNRTQSVKGGKHVHARYPMGHPANPRPLTQKDVNAMNKTPKRGFKKF